MPSIYTPGKNPALALYDNWRDLVDTAGRVDEVNEYPQSTKGMSTYDACVGPGYSVGGAPNVFVTANYTDAQGNPIFGMYHTPYRTEMMALRADGAFMLSGGGRGNDLMILCRSSFLGPVRRASRWHVLVEPTHVSVNPWSRDTDFSKIPYLQVHAFGPGRWYRLVETSEDIWDIVPTEDADQFQWNAYELFTRRRIRRERLNTARKYNVRTNFDVRQNGEKLTPDKAITAIAAAFELDEPVKRTPNKRLVEARRG